MVVHHEIKWYPLANTIFEKMLHPAPATPVSSRQGQVSRDNEREDDSKQTSKR